MIDPKNRKLIYNQFIIWAILLMASIMVYKGHYGIHLNTSFVITYTVVFIIIFAINIYLILISTRPEIKEIEDQLISKEKQFNNEKDRLEIENRLYKILFESIIDPVFIIDHQLNLFYFNNKFEQLFKINQTSLSQPLIQVVRNFEFQNFINKGLEKNQQIELYSFSFAEEHEANKKFFDIKLIPIKFSSHYLCVLNDITEKKMTDQIREDFISNFSHEIRTPLTILNGQLQTLKEDLKKIPNTEIDFNSHLNKIDNNSRRLTSLFDDMLSLTSVEKKKNLTLEKFDIEPLLDILTQDLLLKYHDKKIQFEFNLQNKMIVADYNLIDQCLLNLIENSIKYSKDDCHIQIQSTIENEFYHIAITDNGIGIPDGHRHRVFERFFRVDPSRSSEISGTGLGLSIVKHIIQKHNGKIKIISEENVGTSITISLPVLKSY